MGTVYRARGANEEPFAVKFLAPALAAEPDFVARFWREVKLLTQLDHPGIVRVHAQGEAQGIPWFCMELVEGPNLAQRLSQSALTVEEARQVFSRLLGALAHAHKHGIVHRDLKPANVLLAKDGAKLADFGIAHLDRDLCSGKTQLTSAYSVLGTFPYMSPEQRAGRPIDARSDLYSVGVMLYEALAGERPEGAFAPLHQVRPELSKRADEFVLRLLQPSPSARIASAMEASRQLHAALGKRTARRGWALASATTAVVAGVVGATAFSRQPKVPPLPHASAAAVSVTQLQTIQLAPITPSASDVTPAASQTPVGTSSVPNVVRTNARKKAPVKQSADPTNGTVEPGATGEITSPSKKSKSATIADLDMPSKAAIDSKEPVLDAAKGQEGQSLDSKEPAGKRKGKSPPSK